MMEEVRNQLYCFSNTELNQMAVQLLPRRSLSSTYLEERETVWQEEMAKSVARNDSMWNGEIYTLEEIRTPGVDRVILAMSTCEFKDVVLRIVKGKTDIQQRYGDSHIAELMGVSCIPITRDSKYVFGVRGDYAGRGTHPIGLIGGTLNKDEMEVNNFMDVCQFMHRELSEETSFDCRIEDLRFIALGQAPNSFMFLFTVHIGFDGEEITNCHRGGEFSHLIALSADEAQAVQVPMTPGYRYWRGHLDIISSHPEQCCPGKPTHS